LINSWLAEPCIKNQSISCVSIGEIVSLAGSVRAIALVVPIYPKRNFAGNSKWPDVGRPLDELDPDVLGSEE